MIRSLRGQIWRPVFCMSLILMYLFFVTQNCFAQSKETVYDGGMISSGRNRPSINLGREHLLDLCAMLHKRISLPEIRKHFSWSETDLNERLDKLMVEGLVKEDAHGTFYPTMTVITIDDGKRYFKVSEAVAKVGERIVVDKLPAIKDAAARIPTLQGVPFANVSLFLLSDVLLDNWQISNIERDFVQADRPLHNGMRYYYSVFERPRDGVTSAFGFYGNWGTRWGTTSLSDYGNRHLDGQSLVSLPNADLIRLFSGNPSDSAEDVRTQLGNRLVTAARGDMSVLTERDRQALSGQGLISGDKLNILVVRDEDNKSLHEVADLITKDLASSLNRYRPHLAAVYRHSPYAEEISFNEYLIFWYHFFYTAVTDRLIRSGKIQIPPSGGATYLWVAH